jgi:hypothetical protein
MTNGNRPPARCPACDAELYPLSRLRPQPTLSPLAKALLILGISLSAAIFVLGMAWSMYQRMLYDEKPMAPRVRPSGGLVGIVYLIPALVPGLALGLLAYRLPKVLSFRCRNCGWRERYKLGRLGTATPTRLGATPTRAGPIQTASGPTPLDRVTDGPPAPWATESPLEPDDLTVEETMAWIRQQFRTYHLAEDIAAELTARGWPPDRAEELVEAGRQQTRHQRR